MKQITTDATKTEHVHVRTKQAAINLLCIMLRDDERLHKDDYLSNRAGYTVFRVTGHMEDHGTVSDLGTRLEINAPSGATTCIWWDED